MSNFTCKIASLLDIEKRWNTLIKSHSDNPNWLIWKNNTITNNKNNYRIIYYGYLDGIIISEATAIISPLDTAILNGEKLISKDMAYLTGFRTDNLEIVLIPVILPKTLLEIAEDNSIYSFKSFINTLFKALASNSL